MTAHDYIFLGTGAAALSLLMRMIDSGKFSDKKILLIDRDQKMSNDRTWCFWEKGEGYFESLVHKSWDHLSFKSDDFSSRLEIGDYRYKMIRGIDFYRYSFSRIHEQSNIELRYGKVGTQYKDDNTSYYLDHKPLEIGNAIIFNSIFLDQNLIKDGPGSLIQHFQGWMIETTLPVFDESEATLMDFRVHQNYGTTFVYVLPLTPNKALVEYTVFSTSLLPAEIYYQELEDYIRSYLTTNKYKILETEGGAIPMSAANSPFYKNGVYNIGMVGGRTKASTGYTFSFIQKHSENIVHALINGGILTDINDSNKRFKFYDRVLLQALTNGKPGGKEIFTRLFERNKADSIFKFLDNESSISEELALIKTLQTVPFLKAALQQVL